MMPSKDYLSRSLFAVYRELLLEEDANPDLEQELFRLSEEASVFTPYEIQSNRKRLKDMKALLSFRHLTCHIDGSLVAFYKEPDKKEGKVVFGSSSFVVKSDDELLMKHSFSIPSTYKGVDTNSHIAEYQALVSCLRVLSMYHTNPEQLDLTVCSDSEVLVNQINMRVRTRNDVQRVLRDDALFYMKRFNDVIVEHTPREENKEADALAKQSTDKMREAYS